MMRERGLMGLHLLVKALGALTLLALAAFGPLLASGDWGRLARAIDSSSTHSGPFTHDGKRYRPDEIDLLATLPPLDDNGLRYVEMPSLRGDHIGMVISIPAQGERAKGIIKTFAQSADDEGRLVLKRTITFSMSRAAASQLLRDVERMTKGWPGERPYCIDGTGAVFELAIQGAVTSGSGNSGCRGHYYDLSHRILAPVRHLFPD